MQTNSTVTILQRAPGALTQSLRLGHRTCGPSSRSVLLRKKHSDLRLFFITAPSCLRGKPFYIPLRAKRSASYSLAVMRDSARYSQLGTRYSALGTDCCRVGQSAPRCYTNQLNCHFCSALSGVCKEIMLNRAISRLSAGAPPLAAIGEVERL